MSQRPPTARSARPPGGWFHMKWPNKAGGNARPAQLAAIGWCGSARLVRHSLRPHSSYSISKSFVNAKAERRQYRCTASDADKVHG
ncbi:hypothetical protein ET532_001540 [Verminephrobacter sp. Larva24]|nr:hypothetical protein ET532_001540 [Verminephrobacter sp. Larva24]